MIATSSASWHDVNQRYLSITLEGIRERLQQAVQGDGAIASSSPPDLDAIWHPDRTSVAPPSLLTLCHAFNLSSFERDVLLLCAGVELSASIAQLCSKAQGNPQLSYPTFSLALATFPEAHWSALTPARPLRRWRLVEVSNGDSLTQSRLRIDERVLHYLNGVSYLDDRLRGLITPLNINPILSPSHHDLVDHLTSLWSQQDSTGSPAIAQLCGEDVDSKRAIALVASQTLGMTLHTLRAADLPQSPAEREALSRLWERESILSASALLVDGEELETGDRLRLLPFLEALQSPILIATREPLPLNHRPTLRFDIPTLTAAEQRQLWQTALSPTHPHLLPHIDLITAQFNLNATTIHTITTQLSSHPPSTIHHSPSTTLWHLCRTHSRTRLDNLAQRIEAIATWDDLVLPDEQQQTLQEIAAQVRQRTTVYDTWEFSRRGANGLGISALFAGASGTGKTMAAEVLANELQLDLYRIDLSQVVSKYIGETEKNLRRVFDAAEGGGAILLFDEADALFGKRSDVKDSHDRYANIEVSYLLQRMEAYRGLAVLTSNFRSAIDTAFLRRLRFVVQFPFPDVVQRTEIWQRLFPAKLPTRDLDFYKLAQLNIAGGNIRTIALNAAFLAADAGEPLQMKHLLRAARSEYGKLEKTLTDAEIGDWL